MGGFGSGQHNRTDRLTTDDCDVLTIPRLLACSTSRETIEGGELDWIKPGQPRLRVRFVSTPQPGGGERYWFECPECRRRCARLYSPSAAWPWRCRHCWKLGYTSQRLEPADRLRRNADRLMWQLKAAAMLRGAPTGQAPEPTKPKRMRWATYHRIVERAAAYESKALEIIHAKLGFLSPIIS
jgi:hypothetical protein